MKKIFLFALLFFLPLNAFSSGVNAKISRLSIADAIKLADDSYVSVVGNIEKKISSDKYLFKDTTGSIIVEIDDEKWNDINLSTKDTLELTGEIEKKFNSVYLDVHSLKKVK